MRIESTVRGLDAGRAAARTTTRAAAALAAALLLAPASAFAQAAPQADTLARLVSGKSITLGVRTDAVPFSYLDPMGKPAGFSWTLCQAVVQQLAAELKTPLAVKFVPVSLDESFSQLRQGAIDLHCGATAHTAERARQVDFSDTFYVSRVVAAHRAGDAAFASPRAFGRTGVLAGSTAERLMKTYAVQKASTLTLGPLTPLASYAEGAKLLKSGAIDTLVADEVLMPKDAAIAVRREQLTIEPYALVLRKGDAAFGAAIDRALRKVLGGAQGKALADAAGVKVDAMTQDAWRKPSKHPAPPVL